MNMVDKSIHNHIFMIILFYYDDRYYKVIKT